MDPLPRGVQCGERVRAYSAIFEKEDTRAGVRCGF